MLSTCSNLRMCQLSPQEACSFLATQQNSPYFSALVSHLASGPVVAMELMAASGVRKLLDILGGTGATMFAVQHRATSTSSRLLAGPGAELLLQCFAMVCSA
jgi:hypothetical protein